MIKDHPFADGCKRIAASLFLEFLERNQAGEMGLSIQETIKVKMLKNYILNPIEATKRAMDPKFQKEHLGNTFELPDLYSDEEWPADDRGVAGAFGKAFFNYVYKREPGNIRYVDGGRDGKRAVYKLVDDSNID